VPDRLMDRIKVVIGGSVSLSRRMGGRVRFIRRMCVAVLVASAVACSLAVSASAAPEITEFKATPKKLSSAGGEVRFSAVLPGGATCQVLATPSYGGLPAAFPCGPSTSWLVTVPPNTSASPVTYRYSLQATYPLGPTITSKTSILVSESPAPAVTYVALGDSFASGEGNPGKPPKEWFNRAGKPTEVDNGCHRSSVAYPAKVAGWLKSSTTQATLGLPAMSLDFLACSGATTEDLWDSGAHSAPYYLKERDNLEWQQMQDTRDLANARIVTVMVGGDDLSFADIMKNCMFSEREACSSSSTDGWIAKLQQNIATLKPLLINTYDRVAALAPNAAVYVVGYPDLFPPVTDQQRLSECERATRVPGGGLTQQGAGYLSERQSELANMVKAAAAAAHVYFVDPNAPGNYSYGGHDVCEPSGSWFNKPNVLTPEYSFHPNGAGQKALAQDVKAAIRSTAAPSNRWATMTLPLPAGADPDSSVSVGGVSCATESFCVAVGAFSEPAAPSVAHPLIDAWDGTKWANQATPAGIAIATSVSCATPTQCVAIAERVANSYPDTSIVWDGSVWTVHAMLTPPNSTSEFAIRNVSCVPGGPCEAVGVGVENVYPGEFPIAELWNGSAWVAQTAAAPQEAAWFSGVSCPAATNCMAVGEQDKPFAHEALAETWNGLAWTEVPTPGVSSQFGRLSAVSCTSTSNCTAVGTKGSGTEGDPRCAITEQWDGSQWNLDTPPECSGPSDNVSCWTANGCRSFAGTEAFEWNGTTWTAEATGLPSLAGDGFISCSSATFCFAAATTVGPSVYLRH
jgi:GDSL-like Lipase/Acylhydrolase family